MTPRPIIRFVVGSLRRGGAERTVKELAVGLDGYDVRVTCFVDDGPYRDDILAAGVPIEVIELPTLWGVDGIRGLRALAASLRREPPAILQSFGYGADVAASVAGRLAGVPWIITTRRSTGVEKPAHRWVYRAINPLAHRVLAVSEESRRWTVRHEGVSETKVRAIPNGVDAERFTPGTPSSAGDGVIRIGTVGNVRPAKGIDLLLRAFATTRRNRPAIPTRLCIAGEVRASVREEVAGLLDELDLRSDVDLVGEIDDVPAFLRTLDVFALSSVREGMSNALLEAIACGLPVVASAVGGNIENVREGEGGRLIRSRDEAAFADALLDLVSDADLRRRYGRFNRELALREYSLEAVVGAHADFYDHLLRGV